MALTDAADAHELEGMSDNAVGLQLIASTVTHLRAELEAPETLTGLLGARVSPNWPTGEYDHDAMRFFLDQLMEGGDAAAGWYGWYAIANDPADGAPALVGCGGYFGPPDSEGSVEVGYSVLPDYQGRGYATAMTRLLRDRAFALASVTRMMAHTHDSNRASATVLTRCGFQATSEHNEAGARKYVCYRDL